MSGRAIVVVVAAAVVLIAAVWARLAVGGAAPEGMEEAIASIRMTRVWSGVIVGAALGVGGVLLQSLLRNPLASPDLIGPTAGAGLAVTLAAYAAHAMGASGAGSWVGTASAAMVGAIAALALVYALGQRRGVVEPVSLILAGVIVSVIFGAAAALVRHLMPPTPADAAARWMLGGLREDVTVGQLRGVGVLTACGVIAGVLLGRAMDAASLDDDESRSVGVRLGGLRAALFLIAGALTAGAVVLAGPIGFVGLVCPHVVRLAAGPSHRALVIGAALAGSALVVGADALVRTMPGEYGRVPVGIVTALVGGPVFLAMLRGQARRES